MTTQRIEWSVSGTLETQHDFPLESTPPPPTPGEVSVSRSRPLPLADVEITLLAETSDGSGQFVVRAEGRTDAAGRFTLRDRGPDGPTRFRLSARFRNDDLHLRPSATGSGRMTVFQDPMPVTDIRRDVGTLLFSMNAPPTAAGGLQNPDNIVRAIFWTAALRLANRLRRVNPALAFTGRVHVIWPAQRAVSSATHIAGLLTQRQVHVSQSVGNVSKLFILFHEIMHIWNYDHNRGSTDWVGAYLSGRDTMAAQEQPYIAFHEGFCDFAARELLTEFYGEPKRLPLRRSLIARAVNPATPTAVTLAQSERNVNSVISGLRCLTTPDLHRYTFGTAADPDTSDEVLDRAADDPNMRIRPVNPPWPAMTIWEVLAIFLPGPPGSAFPTAWQVGANNTANGIRFFLGRAAALAPAGRVTGQVRRLIVDLIDPAGTMEPMDLATAGG